MPARLSAGRGVAQHPKTGACFDNYRRAADPKTTPPTSCSGPTVIVRAPWRFILFCQVQNSESLLRRGARGLFRSPAGISVCFCSAKPLKFLFRRATVKPSSTALGPRGPRLRRGGGASRHPVLPVLRNFLARMASKTPNGCERHPSGTLTGEKSPLSATARLPENKNHKTGHPHEHKNVTFVEQWLLATTLSTLH